MGTPTTQTTQTVQGFFKSNWITLLTWIVFASVAFGINQVNMKWIDARIATLEALKPAETKWQVEVLAKSVDTMSNDAKKVQGEISDIKAQNGVIINKLENLTDVVKKSVK